MILPQNGFSDIWECQSDIFMVQNTSWVYMRWY